MQNIRRHTEKKEIRLKNGWPVGLAVVCTVLPFLLIPLPYAISDDYLLNYIANGSLGAEYTEYLIYVNILVGLVLKGLYAFTAAVNWYATVLVFVLIASFTVFYKYIWLQTQNIWFIALCGIVNLCVPLYFTFTVVAGLACAAGYCAMIALCQNTKLRFTHWLGAVALVWVGGALRASMLLPMLFVISPLLLECWLDNFEQPESRIFECAAAGCLVLGLALTYTNWMPAMGLCAIMAAWISCHCSVKIRRLVRWGVLLVLLIWISRLIHVWAYSGGVWGQFVDYTSARSKVVDYPFLSYSSHAENFASLGLSENDYACVQAWTFCDKTIFSGQLLRQLAAISSVFEKYLLNPAQLWSSILAQPAAQGVFVLIGVGTVWALLLAKTGKKRYVLLEACCLLGLMLYLLIRQRFVERVYVPILVAGFVTLLCFGRKRKDCYGKIFYLAAFCGTLLLCSWSAGHLVNRTGIQNQQRESLNSVIAYLKEQPDTLFAVQTSLYNTLYYDGVAAFSVKQTDVFENVIKLGSGDSFSGRYYKQLEQFSIQSPDKLMQDLAYQQNLRYVAWDDGLLTTFLQEHVGQVECIAEYQQNGVFVYRYKLVDFVN